MKFSRLIVSLTLALTSAVAFASDYLTIQLKDGPVVIKLSPEVAPQNVARIKALATSGKYNDVAFHRVIDGFMAQTGDVQFGNMHKGFDAMRVGTGGSSAPDLPAEFSNIPFDRGVVGMARSSDPNSANSQFFIVFAPSYFLNGQYTVVGKVVSGMDKVDKIKRGADDNNGAVAKPDRMLRVTID
ncbi:MAG: peptidylprolyl isomerase [Burkholderiales bacterium]|nr:peptidylprolyl isomerase [Burkholderiales bacterium]